VCASFPLTVTEVFQRIFSSEKETLDKGLEKSKQLFSKLSKAVAGKSKVDDAVCRFRGNSCFL
jgi:hypothetical protein